MSKDWKSIPHFGVYGVLAIVHENQGERIILLASRTVIRNRCSRLIVSGVSYNVCKGSRQTRSVSSRKRLALVVEHEGL